MVINLDQRRKILNKIQFMLYQIAHFMGIFFLLLYNFDNNTFIRTIIMITILVGTYQYVEFYLLMVFLVIVLPYYFFKNLWSYGIRRYRSYKLERALQSERYSDKAFAGDNECKICLMPYE